MEAGYDPNLVLQLRRHTVGAIETLAQFRSTDPAAAEAMRTIRLTRRNLEDHWMTALGDIESSDAMVSWRASRLHGLRGRPLSAFADALPDHLRPGGPAAVPISSERRDELLARLEWLERTSLSGDSAEGAPTKAELAALARQLAFWVGRDVDFAHDLVELSVTNMLVGRLLGAATFTSSFASNVVRRMAAPNGPDTNVDRDRYAASLSTAVASLTGDPDACLDLLLDEPTAYALAAWGALDTAMVADFVTSGLRDAVVADPARLADGYEVVQFLTRAANGPLDRGFNAGAALGIATSMEIYLDTLAEAIQSTTPSAHLAVNDDARDLSVDFGTYADLQGLFGAVVRHDEGRRALGAITASWAQSALLAADSLPAFDHAVTTVSRGTSMIVDAADREQEQVIAEGAAEESRNRQVGDMLAFGADLALGARGAPPGFSLVSRLVVPATVWLGAHDADDVAATGLGEEVLRQMQVTAISIGVSRPGFFGSDGDAAPLTSAQRRTVTARLRNIRGRADDATRAEDVDTLMSNISHTPVLLPALNSITDNPSAMQLVGR